MLLFTTLLLAMCGTAGLSTAAAADTEASDSQAGTAEVKERAAWETFARSLKTEVFAKDYPGPLRDLDSGDREKTVKALNGLGASEAIEAIPSIVPFLDSPRPEIRVYAGLNLERIVSGIELKRRDMAHPDRIVLRPRTPKDPDLTPLRYVVRRMLKSEDNGNTAGYAARMAAYIGLTDLETELRELLRSRHPAVTRSAVYALRTLGFTVEHEPHPLNEGSADKKESPAAGTNKHPDLGRFGLEFVPVTAERQQQLQKVIAGMKLEFRREGKCETIEDARALLWRSISIASVGPRVCTECNGFFLFSFLDWAKPDDRTFKSGFAVKKGTAEIYSWEDKQSQHPVGGDAEDRAPQP